MKVLVTGATGFVASHLVPSLAGDGHDVIAAGHDPSRRVSADGVVQLDLDLNSFARDELPVVDAIVHLAQANVPFPDGAPALFAVNTASTAQLLEHSRLCGASVFVYASSASVYGPGDRSWREDDATAARDFYSATKIASERLVGAYDTLFSTFVMRFVAPYGPGQRNRLIPRLIESAATGRAISLNEGGRPRMNPVYVGDVVRTVTAALEGGESRVLNVAGDQAVTIRELAELAGAAVGRAPMFEEGSAAVAGDIVCDNTRMKALLGSAELVPIGQGLMRTVGATSPAV